ncbi:hypothetical protein ACVWZA_003313 [Sphingomonas sp. UYAg733]
MHYRLEGRMAGAAAISIDRTIITDSDAMAIADAKAHPVVLGEGLANWARLTREDGTVVWKIGDDA